MAKKQLQYEHNVQTQIEAGFQKGNRPSCWTPLAMLNITSNIKKKTKKNNKNEKNIKQFTIYYRTTIMNIHLYTNVIKKVFFYLLYPRASVSLTAILHYS